PVVMSQDVPRIADVLFVEHEIELKIAAQIDRHAVAGEPDLDIGQRAEVVVHEAGAVARSIDGPAAIGGGGYGGGQQDREQEASATSTKHVCLSYSRRDGPVLQAEQSITQRPARPRPRFESLEPRPDRRRTLSERSVDRDRFRLLHLERELAVAVAH